MNLKNPDIPVNLFSLKNLLAPDETGEPERRFVTDARPSVGVAKQPQFRNLLPGKSRGGLGMSRPPGGIPGGSAHSLDNGVGECGTLDFPAAFNHPGKIVGHDPFGQCFFQARNECVGGFVPAHMTEHHFPR